MRISRKCNKKLMSCLRVPLDVLWIYHIYDNNFEIKNYITKYLKGSCCYFSKEHIYFKYFTKYAFV